MTYKKIGKPSEERCRPIRFMTVENAKEVWRDEQQPLTHQQNIRMVHQKINERITLGTWKQEWGFPGHNFIERRLNECADPRLWDGVAPLLRISDNQYVPNPPSLSEAEG